jgi:hypothetical protein
LQLNGLFHVSGNIFPSKMAEESCANRNGMWEYMTFVRYIKLQAVALLSAMLVIAPWDRARANEIWLSGVDPLVRTVTDPETPSDYIGLFAEDSSWSNAASHVRVFKTSTQWLANASDEILIAMFANLKRRNISLGVEMGLLTRGDPCGSGEGYSGPGVVEKVMARVSRLSGNLLYVAMDEPLWFGRHASGPNACHFSISEIAAKSAAQILTIRRFFPAARIGDIEPIGKREPEDWGNEVSQWTKAYQNAVGEPLHFLHVDVVWAGPWQEQLRTIDDDLHAAGVRLGIIYNGNSDDPTGSEWTRHAEDRFSMIESQLEIIPDDAVLQTWMPQPTHMLPETSPGTMTYLVDRYATRQTRIAGRILAKQVQGRVTDLTGNGLGGVPLHISAVDVGVHGTLIDRKVAAQVPLKSESATVALRINAECDCRGGADISIGPIQYHEGDAPPQLRRLSSRLVERTHIPEAGTTTLLLDRFVATLEQSIKQNSPPFPVTPTSHFVLEFPMRAPYRAQGSGYVAIIFLSREGKELKRIKVQLRPEAVEVATTATIPDGSFQWKHNMANLPSHVGFEVTFEGDSGFRRASVFLVNANGRGSATGRSAPR